MKPVRHLIKYKSVLNTKSIQKNKFTYNIYGMFNLLRKLFILITILLLAASCAVQSTTQTSSNVQLNNYSHQLQVGAKILSIEIADTASKQQQGLSDRASMQQNEGMLFNFGSSVSPTPAFWMKDMNFNLDFIWINQNKIIAVTSEVPAPPKNNGVFDDNNLPLYYPPSPANQVLEVNAGWAEKNNIKAGDQTKILN